MAPDKFLQKLVDVIGIVKAPTMIIILVIALLQVTAAVFISGRDKKALFSTITGLMLMAAMIFYVDRLVLWIAMFVRS